MAKCHTHGLALLWVRISAKEEIVFLSMTLAQINHPLETLHTSGKDEDIISIGQYTKEVLPNRAAKPTISERLKHWIQVSVESSFRTEYASLPCAIGHTK